MILAKWTNKKPELSQIRKFTSILQQSRTLREQHNQLCAERTTALLGKLRREQRLVQERLVAGQADRAELEHTAACCLAAGRTRDALLADDQIRGREQLILNLRERLAGLHRREQRLTALLALRKARLGAYRSLSRHRRPDSLCSKALITDPVR